MSQNEIRQLLDEAVKSTKYPLEFWLKLIEGLNEEDEIALLQEWENTRFYCSLEELFELAEWGDPESYPIEDNEKIAFIIEKYGLFDLGDGLYAEIIGLRKTTFEAWGSYE